MRDSAGSVPWPIKIGDVVAIVALCLTISVVVTGGFREWTPFGRLSLTDWSRPLLVAIALLVVRHWRYPRPNIASRIWHGLLAIYRAPATRAVLPTFVWTRTSVFVIGFLALSLYGFRETPPIPWRIYDHPLANLPARWDAGWYIDIATNGYKWIETQPNYQQNIAFFPAYPVAIHYASALMARDALWSGVVVSLIAFLAALVYLFRFARERMPEDGAGASVALLAAYPFALFYGNVYTESFFLLTIVAACYHFERDELWKAGVWGLIAGLTRPNGCLLSVALGLLAIRPLWTKPSLPTLAPPIGLSTIARRVAVAALPGVGMLAFSTYIYFLTGNPLQWVTQNAAWGRVYKSIDSLVEAHARVIGEHGLYTYAARHTIDVMQTGAILLALIAVVPVIRRFGVAYGALILVNIVPPLLMGGLLSMGRMTSTLFPIFLWLGAAIPAHHRFGWVVFFAMLQALCASLFFTWRPLF